jgi:heme o synthase
MADLGASLVEETQSRALTSGAGGDVGDYFALMKPRVMSLVIFTALVGMMAAPGEIHPVIGFLALLIIAIGAGASGALNMWYDADIDAKMQRTIKRPIPMGRVTKEEALVFGGVFSAGSVLCLGVMVNWVAAGLLALTIAYYLFVYTMGLKRRTPHNIVIGGAAGAFPPMIGWAAVTGTVSLESIVLFLIIFMWTPPHFWALCLYRCDDYKRANIPMLPVVAGPDETRRQILLYSLILIPITLMPVPLALGGMIYGVVASALGGLFLWFAIDVFRNREGKQADRSAKKLFTFSIFYLFALFLTLLVENALGLMMPIFN